MKFWVLSVLFAFSAASADDRVDAESPKLDRPYVRTVPTVDDTRDFDFSRIFSFRRILPSASNLSEMFASMTPVRSQGSRGTCSIFSATALLESLLVRDYGWSTTVTDLSEEWLAFLATQYHQADGSMAYVNFDLLRKNGMSYEKDMPYESDNWENLDVASHPVASKRCGHLSGNQLKVCLIGHRSGELMNMTDAQLMDESLALYDPSFVDSRQRAQSFRTEYFATTPRQYNVSSVSTIKQMLAAGIPLVLEVDFFYGAWNHRVADRLGIGRDAAAFSRGEVGYPEYGSMDRKNSREEPAGHSIVVVGYDDNAVITTRVKMEDGTMKDFTYTGVYYFKNSWGTSSFGSNLSLNGSTPGYGVMTYKYAHDFGAFYQLPLSGNGG